MYSISSSIPTAGQIERFVETTHLSFRLGAWYELLNTCYVSLFVLNSASIVIAVLTFSSYSE